MTTNTNNGTLADTRQEKAYTDLCNLLLEHEVFTPIYDAAFTMRALQLALESDRGEQHVGELAGAAAVIYKKLNWMVEEIQEKMFAAGVRAAA